MKKLKKHLSLMLFLAAMFTPLLLLAQDNGTTKVETTVLEYTYKLAISLFPAILLGALATAANHLMAGTFRLKLWLADTGWPALIAYIIAIALGLIDQKLQVLDGFIETIFQIKTDANDILALASVAWVLVPMVKGLFKRGTTQTKVVEKKLLEKV